MTEIPIFCTDCGANGSVPFGQVTASLACRSCGSSRLGLVGVDARPSVVASRKVAHPQGPGTGWTGPDPRRYDGYNEYVGPTPQTYPRAPVDGTASSTCPVCHGAKYDLIDKGPCRECGGSGVITHPTGAPPVESYDTRVPSPAGGAEWRGASLRGGFTAEAMARIPQREAGRPSTDPYGSPESHIQATTPGYNGNPAKLPNTSPMVKVREDRDYSAPTGPYQMDQASCPNCAHSPTTLEKDKNEDAWWKCPNCGPLANIDKNPHINPYSPPEEFQPDRTMKTGGFLSRNKRTGRVLRILAAIHEGNDGLNVQEAVELARKTVIAYPEGR